MKVQQVGFVSASEVFAGANNAYQAFADSDPDVTWGDAKHTLVGQDVIVRELCSAVEFPEYDKLDAVDLDALTPVQREAWVALDRIEGLPETVLIDLES